jgi:large subunit ribosomal protein L31e
MVKTMAEEKKERLYTIPLGKAYNYVRTKRAIRAVDLLRAFVARHMKVPSWSVKISEALNESIWSRSMQKPPRKVKVKVVAEGEIVKVSLPDEKPKVKKDRSKKKKTPKAAEAKTEAKAEVKAGEKKDEKAAKEEKKPAEKLASKPVK